MTIVDDLLQLRASADASFHSELDRVITEKARAHQLALTSAASAHDRVFQSAEIARQQFEYELQRQIVLREEEEKRELDRIKRESAEHEIAFRQRQIEEAQRAQQVQEEHEKRKAVLEAEAAALEEERRRSVQEQRESEERERNRRESEARAAQSRARLDDTAREQPGPTAPPIKLPTTQPVIDPSDDREAVHRQMVQIHQNLKQLRASVTGWAKNSPTWRSKLGDMRRQIRKCVGQLTEGRGANKEPVRSIMEALKETQNDTESPRVDITTFIASANEYELDPSTGNQSPSAPSTFVYMLNIFAKAVMAQFLDEASVSPKAADPIGVVTAQIFATPAFQWRDIPLIDILMSKFHVVCPVLWGIYGDEKTNAGKSRLGWWREDKGGPWVSDQRHGERMTGLGAGFASIALRNFEKSKMQNPYPNWKFWQSLQYIVSVPPQSATWTHYTVAKAMIEAHEVRIMEFFGQAGRAALQKALREFPETSQTRSAAASALSVVPDVLKRDSMITI